MRQSSKLLPFVSMVLWLGSAQAFKPTEVGHSKVTARGLAAVSGFSRTFSNAARTRIIDYTNDVDSLVTKGAEFWDPKAHCDNELFAGCSTRIDRELDAAGAALCADTPEKERQEVAWEHLGKAFHTLQDFYAHSNFVNREYGGDPKLFEAQKHDPKVSLPLLQGERMKHANGAPTCLPGNVRGKPGHFIYVPDAPLTSGQFPGAGQMLLAAAGGAAAGTVAFKLTRSPALAVGFGTWVSAHALVGPDNTCDHGVDPPGLGEFTRGINKDRPGVQEHDWHEAALASAVRSTTLAAERVAEKARPCSGALDLMFDANFTACPGGCPGGVQDHVVGVLIDTTKSMGPHLDGIAAALEQLVDGTKNLKLHFVLVTFGDPTISEPTERIDAEDLLGRVRALQAGFPEDGGECPEPVIAALEKTATFLEPGSSLLVFTDTTPSDSQRSVTTFEELAKKQIGLEIQLSAGVCVAAPLRGDSGAANARSQGSWGFEIYDELVARAGGQVHHVADSAEEIGATTSSILKRLARGRGQEVLNAAGTMNESALSLAVPVDSTASGLAVSVRFAGAGGTAALSGPDGALVTAEAVGSSAASFYVAAPKSGAFKLTLNGAPGLPYSVRAELVSSLYVDGVTFLTEQGRPGHEGLFPQQGLPIRGESQRLRIDMSEGYESVAFDLIDRAGASLGKLEVTEDSDLKGRFYADVEPKELFRVRARGKDGKGNDFMRVSRRMIESSEIAVAIGVNRPTLVPGGTFSAHFVAANFGKKQSVTFSGATSFGRVRSVTPSVETLDTDEIVEFIVEVEIPSDATPADAGPEGLVSITGGALPSETGAPGNASVITRYLAPDTDGDGAPDVAEQGPSGDEPDFDGNGDGSADFEQPNVVSTASRGETGYMTLALPKGSRFESARTHFPAGVPEERAGDFPLDAVSFRAEVDVPEIELVTILHQAPPYPYAGISRFGDVRGSAEPGWEAVETLAEGDPAERFVTKLGDGAAEDQDSMKNGTLALTLAVGRAPEATPDPEGGPEASCQVAVRGRSTHGAFALGALLLGWAVRRRKR